MNTNEEAKLAALAVHVLEHLRAIIVDLPESTRDLDVRDAVGEDLAWFRCLDIRADGSIQIRIERILAFRLSADATIETVRTYSHGRYDTWAWGVKVRVGWASHSGDSTSESIASATLQLEMAQAAAIAEQRMLSLVDDFKDCHEALAPVLHAAFLRLREEASRRYRAHEGERPKGPVASLLADLGKA